MEALLEQSEAGSAMLVEADDFPIKYDRPAKRAAEAFYNIRKGQLLRLQIAAAKAEARAVEPA